MENWVPIFNFEGYSVSDNGRVMNEKSGRIVKQSLTRTGLVKVGLFKEGVQHTRSVGLLVAEAFVEGQTDWFDTPIHLDGDRFNNFSVNLMWRPRWFAWKFARQFSELGPHNDRGPLMDLETGLVYSNFAEVASTFGILMDDIWKYLIHKKEIFPTKQTFKLIL